MYGRRLRVANDLNYNTNKIILLIEEYREETVIGMQDLVGHDCDDKQQNIQ